VVVVCHSETCSNFQKKSEHPKPTFKTAYDAIFTADLGTMTITHGTSYEICETLLEESFPNTGRELASRLEHMVTWEGGFYDLLGSKTNLNLKTIGTQVADLDIFCDGRIVGNGIDDGIFWFKVGDPPPTTEEVKQRNIAGNMFFYTSPYLFPKDGGLYTSWNTYETSAGKSIKLSDLLKRNGALAQFVYKGDRLDPSSTAVILVTCRVIKGNKGPEDDFAFQSPSPSSSAASSLSPRMLDWLLQTQEPTGTPKSRSVPSSPRSGGSKKTRRPKMKLKKNKKSKKK
jgi:hypothetical protein